MHLLRSSVLLVFVFGTLVDASPVTHHERLRHRHVRPHNKYTSESPPATLASASPYLSSLYSSLKGLSSPIHIRATEPSSMARALFPVLQPSREDLGWTTALTLPNPLPLASSTLNPTHIMSELPITFTSAPDGKPALKAHYPRGSYTLTREPKGGISCYASGPAAVDLTKAKEATLGYSIYFEEGFEWQKGGKLPGLYGGNSLEESVGCSGGRRSSACFSARMMWRTDGAGEMYTYLPPYTEPQFTANKAVCSIPPLSTCNPTYGASVGRGAFYFQSGQWNTVSQRVRLNDIGVANGELELYVGGKSVIRVTGLILRDGEDGRIRGIQMQTFFGGSEVDFACPKDQNAYFADFSVAITKTL